MAKSRLSLARSVFVKPAAMTVNRQTATRSVPHDRRDGDSGVASHHRPPCARTSWRKASRDRVFRAGHRGAGAIALANSDEAIERPDGGDGGALERRGKDDELFPVL